MTRVNLGALGGLLALALLLRAGVAFTEHRALVGSSLTADVVATSPTTDLQITATGPASVVRAAGNNFTSLTYEMIIKNVSQTSALNVRVTAPIPAGLTLESISHTSCGVVSDLLSCTFPTITQGQSIQVQAKFRLPALVMACTDTQQVQFRSFLWSDTVDTQMANNQSAVTTSVTCPTAAQTADVSLYITGAESVVRGASFSTTLYAKNSGGAAAQSVVIVNPVPANMTYIDTQSDARCDLVGINVMCQIGTLAANQSADPVNIVFQTSAQIPCGVASYTATVGTVTQDSNTANNQSTYQLSVSCGGNSSAASQQSSSLSMYSDWSMGSSARSSSSSSRVIGTTGADVELTAVAPATVERGFTFTHTFTLTNYGPQAATYPAVYDPMGVGFTFEPVGSDSRCKMEGGNIKCSGPINMPAGTSETFVVVVRSGGTQACNATTIINPSIYNYTQDPVQANNRLSLPIKVTCVSPNPPPPPPPPPPPVSSAASSRASSVMSFEPCQFVGCSSRSSVSSAATSMAPADLVVLTRIDSSTITPGQPFTYTMQFWNNGPGAATNIRTTTTLLPGMTLDAAQSDSRCVQNGQSLSCAVSQLASKERVETFSITFKTATNLSCGTINLMTDITSDAADPSTVNNRTNLFLQGQCGTPQKADLNLLAPGASTSTLETTGQGGSVVQKMMFFNAGPAAAPNAVIKVPVPAGFTYIDARSDSRCDLSGSTVVCPVGTVAVSSTVMQYLNVAFSVSPTQTCGGVISSMATFTSDLTDPYAGNNTLEVRTNVRCASTSTVTVTMPVVIDTDSAAKNQKNVKLMRFYAQPDSTRDVLFTGARFAATDGTAQNATNYTLWIDMDYNGTTETYLKAGVNPVNGVVTFDALPGGGQIIQAGRGMAMEVHADIAGTLVSNKLQLSFDTTGTNDYLSFEASDGYISRVATNGACPGGVCRIYVTVAPTMSWYLANQGNLYITRDAELVRSKQLLAGVLGDTVLRLNFRAPNEEIDVYQLQLSTWDSTAVSVDRLELYKLGEITPFAVATTAACGNTPVLTTNSTNGKAIRTFCASMTNSQLVIPTYQDIDVLVKPFLKTDEDGAISGESLTFWLPSRPGVVKARGVGSANALADNDGDTIGEGEVFMGVNKAGPGTHVVGNPNQSVLSKILLIYNIAPNPGRIMVGAGQEIGRFRVGTTNNANTKNGLNKPVIADIIFSVASANVTLNMSTFKIANVLDYLNPKPCTTVPGGAAGEVLVECRGVSFEANPTLDVSLIADITGVGFTGAWVQASLKNFADINALQFGPNLGQSRLRWMDTDVFTKEFFWVEAGETTVNSSKFMP